MRKKEIIFLVIVIGVVAALFATGVLDWEVVYGRIRAIFYRAPEVLSGPQPGSLENAAICRANLKAIESAKRRVAEKKGLTAGARLTWEDICKEMGWKEPPKCPDGGTYALNPLGILPTCSIGDNGTLDQRDDHQIRNY